MTHSPWRIATDVGGTFTDLVLDDGASLRAFKAPTTPGDPARGVLDAVAAAAACVGTTTDQLLARCGVFVHGTTRALNAMLTGGTARTALLVTAGHRDVLLFREGGRHAPFDLGTEYPEPYVPRSLTFEVPERILSTGEVRRPLDEEAVVSTLRDLSSRGVEAFAVCLLWSIVDGAHEQRVGELIEQHLPGIPYTLSHRLNPTLREYRRASSTVIDASLKPLMSSYIAALGGTLRAAGLAGELVLVSSAGATIGADAAAAAPIHAINSGPAMAPSAAARVVRALADDDVFDAVVFDSGGTTCDITLVRAGEIVTTRETWIGRIGAGHITGFPSVDIRSIAAGGGSIARVDAGGLLHVGPDSAGAEPGPACYGNGGTQPTLTDAALIAGYLDGDTFLGGGSSLSLTAARAAVDQVAQRLSVDVETAAASIVDLATEQMVGAIEQIVLGRGVDPRSAIIVGAGGAAGLNVVEIARRLGARRAVVPAFASVLSAAGALMSPLSHDYTVAAPVSSARFDPDVIDRALRLLRRHEDEFAGLYGLDVVSIDRAYSVEARYEHQVWDLVVAIPALERIDAGSLAELTEAFHRAHESSFGMRSPDVPVEFLSWNVKVSAPEAVTPAAFVASAPRAPRSRTLLFDAVPHHAEVVSVADLAEGARVEGPAVVEATSTSVVLPPGSAATLTAAGHLLLEPFADRPESASTAPAVYSGSA